MYTAAGQTAAQNHVPVCDFVHAVKGAHVHSRSTTPAVIGHSGSQSPGSAAVMAAATCHSFTADREQWCAYVNEAHC